MDTQGAPICPNCGHGLEPLLVSLSRLPADLRQAASSLGEGEARFLVDTYYQLQDFRKATGNQRRSLTESAEPHETISFFYGQFDALEKQIKGALDVYSAADPLGEWARRQVGIGPVIAAGLLAHIDFTVPTVGHIWRFAGLDPTVRWEKSKRRPWNAELKTLCWKIGDSFVKFSGREDCFYGQHYRQRKVYEVERDERGGNAETAAQTLKDRQIRDAETRRVYESGRLPAGRLDLRARRWAVKLFLAHLWEEGYRQRTGNEPLAPYPIAHLGHVHRIEAPTS
jgi:hypothetical protein